MLLDNMYKDRGRGKEERKIHYVNLKKIYSKNKFDKMQSTVCTISILMAEAFSTCRDTNSIFSFALIFPHN